MPESPSSILSSVIDRQATEAVRRSAWGKGAFRRIRNIEIDSRGSVGEGFVAKVLIALGYSAEFNNETDPEAKHWDVLVNDTYGLEVKTASATFPKRGGNPTFQHEGLQKNRNYGAVVLVDICPDDIYLTVAPKSTLPFTRKNKKWTFVSKKMHYRARTKQYKWTLAFRDVKDRKVETLEDVREMFVPVLGEP